MNFFLSSLRSIGSVSYQIISWLTWHIVVARFQLIKVVDGQHGVPYYVSMEINYKRVLQSKCFRWRDHDFFSVRPRLTQMGNKLQFDRFVYLFRGDSENDCHAWNVKLGATLFNVKTAVTKLTHHSVHLALMTVRNQFEACSKLLCNRRQNRLKLRQSRWTAFPSLHFFRSKRKCKFMDMQQ